MIGVGLWIGEVLEKLAVRDHETTCVGGKIFKAQLLNPRAPMSVGGIIIRVGIFYRCKKKAQYIHKNLEAYLVKFRKINK